MAKTYVIECKCGYANVLFEGEGLLARNLDYIRMAFSSEQLEGFEQAFASGVLAGYGLQGRISSCIKCRKLYSNDVLHYIIDGHERRLVRPCIECNGEMTPHELPPACPECSQKTIIREG